MRKTERGMETAKFFKAETGVGADLWLAQAQTTLFFLIPKTVTSDRLTVTCDKLTALLPARAQWIVEVAEGGICDGRGGAIRNGKVSTTKPCIRTLGLAKPWESMPLHIVWRWRIVCGFPTNYPKDALCVLVSSREGAVRELRGGSAADNCGHTAGRQVERYLVASGHAAGHGGHFPIRDHRNRYVTDIEMHVGATAVEVGSQAKVFLVRAKRWNKGFAVEVVAG